MPVQDLRRKFEPARHVTWEWTRQFRVRLTPPAWTERRSVDCTVRARICRDGAWAPCHTELLWPVVCMPASILLGNGQVMLREHNGRLGTSCSGGSCFWGRLERRPRGHWPQDGVWALTEAGSCGRWLVGLGVWPQAWKWPVGSCMCRDVDGSPFSRDVGCVRCTIPVAGLHT